MEHRGGAVIRAWFQKRKLARQRLADEYVAAQLARPCVEYYSYATSTGGLVECSTHGRPYSSCQWARAARKAQP